MSVTTEILRRAALPSVRGEVVRAGGLSIGVAGVEVAIGDAVHIDTANGTLPAEVVAIDDGIAVCMPLAELTGVRLGAAVAATGEPLRVPVGAGLLGRVVDAFGRPIDDGPVLRDVEPAFLNAAAPHPLRRPMLDAQLGVGVRVIDTLTPVGRGQRIGIFAGSGVGKSTLLSMITRGTDAAVCVLALIGERAREVREFVEHDLGPEGLARSVVVVATSDQPPLVRLRAALTATRIAEGFRDDGADVLLMMDSLTRCAMAQREVGLSAGEPPTTRGFPPSTFAMLPRLLERAGTAERGSITGIYTVLVDGDDMNDPVADAARSLLDGHIVLSRALTSAGHFPSVEPLDSLSRVARAVTTPEQNAAAIELRRLLAALREAKDLVEIGAYAAGSNPDVDRGLALSPAIRSFLQQDSSDVRPIDESWAALHALVRSA